MPTFAFVVPTLDPSCLAGPIALGLAGLGHEVHVLIAPAVGSEGEEPSPDLPETGRMMVHRLPADRPRRSFPLLGPILARRARRGAIARLLRDLDPQVVHLADEADRRLPVPPGALVLQGVADGPPPPFADAIVLPDGRLLDRSGLPVPSPGTPPRPSGGPVDDGLDPIASASQWRLLTFLSGVDQLRRDRRARLDRPHPSAPPPRLSPRRLPIAVGMGRAS